MCVYFGVVYMWCGYKLVICVVVLVVIGVVDCVFDFVGFIYKDYFVMLVDVVKDVYSVFFVV